MLEYLKKYNNLPQDLRDKFSAPDVLASVEAIEDKYNVSLATVIMRVLIKDIAIVDLSNFLTFEFSLDAKRAGGLCRELEEKVFSVATDYLGIVKSKPIAVAEAVPPKQDPVSARITFQSSTSLYPISDVEMDNEKVKKVGIIVDESRKAQSEPGSHPVVKKMDEAMRKVDYRFSSEEMDNRFKSIIETYLRGVRNKIDVKQALMKGVDVGGLSMHNEAVNEIFEKIDSVKKKYDDPKLSPFSNFRITDKENMTKEMPLRDSDYDFSKLKAEQSKQGLVLPVPQNELMIMDDDHHSLMVIDPINGMSRAKKAKLDKVLLTFHNEKIIEEKKYEQKVVSNDFKYYLDKLRDSEEKKSVVAQDGRANTADEIVNNINLEAGKVEIAEPPKESTSEVLREIVTEREKPEIMQTPIAAKRRMDDVKYVPKLVSPVEELKIMNLINFRRLNRIPLEAAKKINEKIDFLEDDGGYAKKLEGIKAWRQSPLNKLYIAIGQEAISSVGGINAIIKTRSEKQQEFLTDEEFAAIMDLNKNLRF